MIPANSRASACAVVEANHPTQEGPAAATGAVAASRALDSLAPADEPLTSRRARLCAAIDRALEHGNRIQKDRDRGQTQLFDVLFGGGDEADAAPVLDLALPDAEPWTSAQVLAFEKEALGLY